MRITLVTVFALLVGLSTSAQAKVHRHPFHHQASQSQHHHRYVTRHRHRGVRYAGRGRPFAWCGWYARHNLVGVDPGPDYNLARNWARWGRAVLPTVGAIVVWSHHVGKIVGGSPGHWVIQSGNDGHAVRSRERSIAGAIAFRM